MDKRLRNGLIAIVGIVLVSVCITRGCAFSETVADYQKSHEEEEKVVPIIEEVEQTAREEVPTSAADAVATTKQESISEQTPEPTSEPTPEPTPEATPEADKATESSERIYAADDHDFYIEEISEELKTRMQGKSYAENIDESIMNYSMLRHLVIKYNDFNNEVQVGEIVCNEKIAADLLDIFEKLYKNGYQLERVQLIDEYEADDDASMAADNTSCFNYRVVEGSTKLSYHAYGLAIDVNPFYNPYVQMRNGALHIDPPGSEPYANREENFPYKIDENDLAYKLFKQHGFIWGGDWNNCKDYQHFEKRI